MNVLLTNSVTLISLLNLSYHKDILLVRIVLIYNVFAHMITSKELYMKLTLLSEILNIGRNDIRIYIAKVCVDMIREIQKPIILSNI